MTLSRQQVGDLLRRNGIVASRALGQNFLADPNTARRIARLAGVGPGDRVVEVGAGLGSLTLALAETGAAVTAIEADRYLLPVLREVVSGAGDVRVVEADALRADWPAMLGAGGGWVMVSNLPYNIAAPLLLDMLDRVPAVQRMLVMVQKEVGERLAAPAGSPAYGAASVKVAYWATARTVGRVPPTVFVPRPRVDSVLVDIRRRDVPAVDPAVVPAAEVFELVRAGFATRRKMLRRSLAGLAGAEDFAASGVPPSCRAEDLDVDAWGRLAAARRRKARAC